jgi:hypothetical protein
MYPEQPWILLKVEKPKTPEKFYIIIKKEAVVACAS